MTMGYKWIGALLILGSCGGFGIGLAVQRKNEERLLCQLAQILEEMLWELPFQLTPLPELLRHAVGRKKGCLSAVLLELARQLDRQVLPDAGSCMTAALETASLNYPSLQRQLDRLGQSLGRFDLEGQCKGLAAVKEGCDAELLRLRDSRDVRLRSYRVLGLCAGAALVILLL